ncbi:MAG: HlyC/CorC family transporter [Gloeomargaritaceae cyanobacterium C42_A2020_066]|nr:HlyC/CorC family transporter [Gloeomargaritaceae cyanobacterium C42_A2020_066]
MSNLTFEVTLILALIAANGLFAMSEMAIVSSRKARLQQRANEGDAGARLALEIAQDPARMISTIQVGITLIGILNGAFGGATIASKLGESLADLPGIGAYSQPISFALVVVIITYLSLVVGELVPKQLALNNPEVVASAIAIPIHRLSLWALPAVRLLSFSTEGILTLLRIQKTSEPVVSEEEIKILMKEGTQAGEFQVAELDMVERVFRLGDQRISALMTPRPDIIWLDLSDPTRVNQQEIIASAHSRFPVCQGDLDSVLGIIDAKNLLSHALAGRPFDLTLGLEDPVYVPESTHALRVLELLKTAGRPMALVVDEYGVIQGLVTLNDLLEAIVGVIPSADTEEPKAIQREDGSWLVDGMLAIDQFRRHFDLSEEELPATGYHTFGGFVISQIGHIPSTADMFSWGGFSFEVMDMDGNRVDKVLVRKLFPPNSAEEKAPDENGG